MYVVTIFSTPSYIAGVFNDKTEAEKCFSDKSTPFHKTIKSCNVKFPFYIVEEARNVGNCFTYRDFHQTCRLLKGIVRINDSEHTYLNIYYINDTFKPIKVGADEMGSLPHIHINNEWLRIYDECGDCLLAEMR